MPQFSLRDSLAVQLPNQRTQKPGGTFSLTSTTVDLDTAVLRLKQPGKLLKLVYKLKIFKLDDAAISPFAHQQI